MLEAQIQRIASVIHDDAGQLLALVHLRLEEAVSRLPLECNSSFDGVRALLGQLETQLRCVSHELRPTILDDLGLIPAVEFLAQGFSQRTGVTVDLTSSLFANRRMGCSTEMALYRAVHEALINIGRYARASRVKICFRTIGRRVRCVIWDNGIGFDMKAKRKRGLGIVSMQERVEGLGGQFAIHSQPGQGTEVVITLPLSST